MKRTRKALLVIMALCGLAATGCQKKVRITFVNHTDETLPVSVTTPSDGTINIGSIGGDSSMRYLVRIPTDDLPALCSAKVGLIGSKSFTISTDTEDEIWFHRTGKGLAGPVGKDTPASVTEKTGEIIIESGSTTIVE